MTLYQSGPRNAGFSDLNVHGFALGDVRLMPRLGLTTEEHEGFDLSLATEVLLPTGDERRFLGDNGIAIRPQTFWGMRMLEWFELRGQLGATLRRDTILASSTPGQSLTIRDTLNIGVGLQWREVLVYKLALQPLLEIYAHALLKKPYDHRGVLLAEALVGAEIEIARSYSVKVGIGVGATRGIGTPDIRMVASIQYTKPQNDRDGDGIDDEVDQCPDEPEDFDQMEDYDGCPDQPIGDRDGDGILDVMDQCPDRKEDKDNFEDSDGCPERDNDRDGVADENDWCPDLQETINGIDDEDGCPDVGEGVTRYIAKERIEVVATIQFETGSARLKDESKTILNQVALQILAHPDIRRIRIEGHTDDHGSDESNLNLSQSRCESVRDYIIKRGVDAVMLDAIGYGETKPIASNQTIEGRAKNRRVEFVIVEGQ